MSTYRDLVPLTAEERLWAGCGCCHERIGQRGAVSIGRPSFHAPAVFVCLQCLEAAAELARGSAQTDQRRRRRRARNVP